MNRTRRGALRSLGSAALVASASAGIHTACALPGRSPSLGGGSFSTSLSGPLLAERDWHADPTMPAIRFSDGALHLRSSPTQTAYVRARFLPTGEQMPVAETEETLEWSCRVVLHGTFFIVLDAELAGSPLRIQVTPYGAHTTAAGPDRVTRGFETHLPPGWPASQRTWTFHRRGASAEVRAGSDRIWQGPVSAPLTSLAFGETAVDSLHAGELWLSNVRWTRRRL